MDQSGAAIPDAMVTALSTQTGLQKSAVSDADGRYTILSLTPGTYDVKSEAKGFATLVQKNSEFLVGTTVTVDFKMQVSAVEQSVEVTASTPEIESTQNTVSRILESKELDDLPVINRSFANLAILTPGVQASGQSFGGNSAASAAISIVKKKATYQKLTICGRWCYELKLEIRVASMFNCGAGIGSRNSPVFERVIPNRIWLFSRRSYKHGAAIRRQSISWPRLRFLSKCGVERGPAIHR